LGLADGDALLVFTGVGDGFVKLGAAEGAMTGFSEGDSFGGLEGRREEEGA